MNDGELFDELEKSIQGLLHESKEFGVKVIPEDLVGDIIHAFLDVIKKEREASLENLLANIKTGWNLSRTKRIKPTGYCGWNLTTYESDDVTILTDIYAKSLDELKKRQDGESVKQGSGRFVNRVPVLDDYETSKEMGRVYPEGGFICSECWAKGRDE